MKNTIKNKLFAARYEWAKKALENYSYNDLMNYAVEKYADSFVKAINEGDKEFDASSMLDEIDLVLDDDEQREEFYKVNGFTQEEIDYLLN